MGFSLPSFSHPVSVLLRFALGKPNYPASHSLLLIQGLRGSTPRALVMNTAALPSAETLLSKVNTVIEEYVVEKVIKNLTRTHSVGLLPLLVSPRISVGTHSTVIVNVINIGVDV